MLNESEIRSIDVAPAEGGAEDRTWLFDERFKVSRATVVKSAVGAAVVWSMALLEAFPLSRAARADGYDIWTSTTTGPCGSGGYAAGHGCSPGCGPSTVCGGVSGGSCCSGGWHRNDGSTYSGYGLRPNQCADGWADGWNWRCSASVLYRCHDGWIYSGSSTWKSICRANV